VSLQDIDRDAAVEAEGAVVLAVLAPRGDQPHLAPEEQAERLDAAVGQLALRIAVGEPRHGVAAERGVQRVERVLDLAGHAEAGREDAGGLGFGAALGGQGAHQLFQRGLDRAGHRAAAPCLDHARPRDQRLDFIGGEHQRSQVEAGPHAVADTGLALDRHARDRQVADVAIHRALGHAQPVGQHRRRGQAAASQDLRNLEEAVGAAGHAAHCSGPVAASNARGLAPMRRRASARARGGCRRCRPARRGAACACLAEGSRRSRYSGVRRRTGRRGRPGRSCADGGRRRWGRP